MAAMHFSHLCPNILTSNRSVKSISATVMEKQQINSSGADHVKGQHSQGWKGCLYGEHEKSSLRFRDIGRMVDDEADWAAFSEVGGED